MSFSLTQSLVLYGFRCVTQQSLGIDTSRFRVRMWVVLYYVEPNTFRSIPRKYSSDLKQEVLL